MFSSDQLGTVAVLGGADVALCPADEEEREIKGSPSTLPDLLCVSPHWWLALCSSCRDGVMGQLGEPISSPGDVWKLTRRGT